MTTTNNRFLTALTLTALVAGAWAQTSAPAKPKKARPAPITAADVQALKDAIASQQAALSQQVAFAFPYAF